MSANGCAAGVCGAKRQIFRLQSNLKIETLAGCRESPSLGLRYKCNKKEVTQVEGTPIMVFADNQEGGQDMSHYTHLSIEEREKLYLMRGQGKRIHEIGVELGRSPSTISRELRRNKPRKHAYSPSSAQRAYEKRRKQCGRKHILSCPEKREYVRRLIQDLHWSPEEIANRLRLESASIQLSYAAIYRAIHAGLFDANKREASRNKKRSFAYCLRRKGKKKGKKGENCRQGQHFAKANRIHDRHVGANERSELGHFEADTLVGKRGGECLLSLVDRKSRFTLAAKLPDGRAESARDAMVSLLSRLPPGTVKSITSDRGSEFALYEEISQALTVPFYFADPHAPWQRGTNENTNGLIREFIPKGHDMALVQDNRLSHFIALLNLRPRKCLDWRSPAEIFSSFLLHLT